jgi:WD40 repeat protein
MDQMNFDELRKSLLDYDYLQTQLNTPETETLIADCELFPDDEVIKLIKSALRLSAHILEKDITALAHQLVGRLMGWRSQYAEIKTFTDYIANHVPGIYPKDLDSPYFSHEPAGGALLRVLNGHKDRVNSVNFSSDGKLFVSAGDSTIKIWDAKSGALLDILEEHTSEVKSATLSSDGQRIVSGSADDTVRIWQVANGSLHHILKGNIGEVYSANFSPDDTLVISAGNSLQIWESDSGKLLHKLRPDVDWVWIYIAKFSPNGKLIVSIANENDGPYSIIEIWEVTSGTLLRTLTEQATTHMLNFSADGQLIVSIYEDSTVRIWDVETGQEIDQFEDTEEGRRQAMYKYPQITQIDDRTYKHANRRVLDISWSRLTVSTPKSTYTFYCDRGIQSASWSPDGVHLVVGDEAGRVILLRVQE